MDADSEKKLFRRIIHIEYQLEEINDKLSNSSKLKDNETQEENFERRLKDAERKASII